MPTGGPQLEQSITALYGPTFTELPGPFYGSNAVINYTVGFNASMLAKKWVEAGIHATILYPDFQTDTRGSGDDSPGPAQYCLNRPWQADCTGIKYTDHSATLITT